MATNDRRDPCGRTTRIYCAVIHAHCNGAMRGPREHIFYISCRCGVVTILILHFDRGGGRPTRLMWKVYTCAMAGFDEVLYVELSRQFDRVYNIIIHASPFPLIVLQHTFFVWFSLYRLMTFFMRTQMNIKNSKLCTLLTTQLNQTRGFARERIIH